MKKDFVISYDLGTSGVKIVFLAIGGQVLASTTEGYPLYTNTQNYAEQDADDFWTAVCSGTKNLLKSSSVRAENCIGLAFGTQWKSIIPVDEHGNVLYRDIIWMDKRAAEEADLLNRAFGEKLFCEADYWPKLYWFRRHKPELYEKTACFMEANCFLKWKATGVVKSDLTNCYTRSYSNEKQAFYDRVLEIADLNPEKFPPLCQPDELVGYITETASTQIGLPAGIPVFGGCCDIPAIAIGCGCSALNTAHAYLGTSGWLACVRPHDPKVLYLAPISKENDVGFYGLGVSVGPSTNWMLDTFYAEEKASMGKTVWSFIDSELSTISAGSDRLLIAPWFFGGRPPFCSGIARGVFVNLNCHHTRAHMLSALFEGFCYIMRQNMEAFKQDSGIWPKKLVVCGGGSKNQYWMQALANILHMEVVIPYEAENAGAIGVGYCVQAGLGKLDGYASGDSCPYEKTYYPHPETFSEYDLLYDQFKKLYDSLTDIFEALNK